MPGGDAVAFDRYAYVNNNPVNFNDPSGHCSGKRGDPNNPDAACWNKISQIEQKYSNVKIQNQDRWVFDELQAIWNALSEHVFRQEIIKW